MPTILLANVMAPYVAWGVGNDGEISVPFSMLATLLAAFLERPFTSAAGFNRNALLYSVRANILSWFLGLLLAYASLSLDRRGSLFFALVFLAIPFSIAIEGGYLSIVKKLDHSRVAWKPVVLGNIFSGLVLLSVTVVGFEWGDRLQLAGAPIINTLRDYRLQFSSVIMYFCIAVFLGAVFVPARWSTPRTRTATVDSPTPSDIAPRQLN